MDIVYKPTISHKSVICVGDVSIPVPPVNVATENYAQWIKDKFDSMKKSREHSGTKSGYLRGVNTERLVFFILVVVAVLGGTNRWRWRWRCCCYCCLFMFLCDSFVRQPIVNFFIFNGFFVIDNFFPYFLISSCVLDRQTF